MVVRLSIVFDIFRSKELNLKQHKIRPITNQSDTHLQIALLDLQQHPRLQSSGTKSFSCQKALLNTENISFEDF
jgi:hypothetical protein